jgi:hypothetical protein
MPGRLGRSNAPAGGPPKSLQWASRCPVSCTTRTPWPQHDPRRRPARDRGPSWAPATCSTMLSPVSFMSSDPKGEVRLGLHEQVPEPTFRRGERLPVI